MRSPHEGPTASRFNLRRLRGPRKFVAASLAIDILSRDCFREEIPFPWFIRIPYTLPDITSSFLRRRGLPAGGAYWPEGPTGLRGRLWPRWPPPWLRPCCLKSEFGSILKNSGLNSWSFQFSGYPRLGPRPKFPPPPQKKIGGWIRQWLGEGYLGTYLLLRSRS